MTTPKNKKTTLGSALRMLAMLRLIPRRGTIGTKALQKRLKELGWDVSLRTIQRDLASLEKVFPGLVCKNRQDIASWSWKADAEVVDVPALDLPMALTLELTRRFLAPVMPPQVLAYLDPYFRAAEGILQQQDGSHWPERIAILPRHLPLIPAPVDPAVFEAVANALSPNPPRVLAATYRSRSGGELTADFHPLGLVFRNEIAYLVATVWEYDDPRHFALHRFEHCQVTERPARQPDDFRFQDYLKRGAFQYPVGDGHSIRLQLRIQRFTATHLAETPLSEDQRLTDLDGDWQRLEATVADTQQLRWWLLGMGDNVIVEAPESLRREIAAILAQAAGAYSDNICRNKASRPCPSGH